MTNDEKLASLVLKVNDDTVSEDLLLEYLLDAEEIVLNRMYPFGVPGGVEVPMKYERTQIAIALELFDKMGAEGQTRHYENGIERTYERAYVSESLLKRIVPHCASVITK